MNGFLFSLKELAVLMSAFIGALIGLFFLRSHAGNRPANKALGLFLLAQSSTSVLSILLYTPQLSPRIDDATRTFFLTVDGILVMAEGFLLYWYTRTLLFKDSTWGRSIYIHIALMLLILCFAHFLTDKSDASVHDLSTMTDAKIQLILCYAVIVLTRAFYAALCFINIKRYQRLLADKYSNTDKLDLSWLKLLIIGYLITRFGHSLTPLTLVVLYYSGHELALAGQIIPYYTFIFDATWLITLSAIFYFALQYSPRFEGLKEKPVFTPQERNGVKTEHSRRLEEYLRLHKPHLQKDLKLDDLADKLSLPPKTLSILLNVHYKMNFCEFINHYRIKEAAAVLSDPQLKRKAVLDIAMEAGFNSKSAFNRAFKKETGLTPLQYRQRTASGAAPSYDSEHG